MIRSDHLIRTKTRSDKPCRSPTVSGRKRCRMHGGALGSRAPRGNKNALKHGLYTREAIEERRATAGADAAVAHADLRHRVIALSWSGSTPAQVTFVACLLPAYGGGHRDRRRFRRRGIRKSHWLAVHLLAPLAEEPRRSIDHLLV